VAANFDFVAVFEIDGRVDHEAIAGCDALADFRLGAEFASFSDLALVRHAVIDHEDLCCGATSP
jgi:hypothetical protein